MRRSDIKALPPLEELQRLFAYDPETGVVRYRVRPNVQARRINPGQVAGRPQTRTGYLIVIMSCEQFLLHRIIWKLQTGNDPIDQIDHIDGDRINNKWINLREADNGKNRHNSKLAKNNRSGVKGVCWDSRHKAWVAYIGLDKRQRKIGRFKVLEQAIAARRRAAEELHGEFARAA